MSSGNTSKIILTIVGIFAGGIILLVAIAVFSVSGLFSDSSEDDSDYSSSLSSGSKIGLVDITGEIFSSDDYVKQIEAFRESGNVRALLVRVNSPGGSVAPSQEIYESIRAFRESGKPVVISMNSVAASGGYYLALGGTTIMANSGTITGSIGVIIQYPQVKPLMDKIGVEVVTVKSGKFKDVGSPFRQQTTEDLAYLQNVINDTYDQFVEAVAIERNLSLDSAKALAEGKIYTGRQAMKNGLVDTIGTFEDAVKLAGKLAGISGKPELIKKRKQERFFDRLLGTDTESMSAIRDIFISKPIVQYRMYP
ncbi:MAG: signal peptide peptidase SppA [Bacteroidetes bacterium]|nr:signal peptide peptidase SppA [Bacteroidota bacterium]